MRSNNKSQPHPAALQDQEWERERNEHTGLFLRRRIGEGRLGYLLTDERHDPDAGEDVLSGQPLPRDPVRKSLRPVGSGLTQVAHEEGDVGPVRDQRSNMKNYNSQHASCLSPAKTQEMLQGGKFTSLSQQQKCNETETGI